VLTVNVGLGVVSSEDLQHREHAHDHQGVCPAAEYGERKKRGEQGGNGGTEVRHKPQQSGKGSEEDGMGQAEEMEAKKDQGAVGQVHQQLQREIAGDAGAGILHGLCHDAQVTVAAEVDDTVAQVFPLEEDEERKDHAQK
jgi:hypothetical protein